MLCKPVETFCFLKYPFLGGGGSNTDLIWENRNKGVIIPLIQNWSLECAKRNFPTYPLFITFMKNMYLCGTLRTELIKDGNCLLLLNFQCLVSTWYTVGAQIFVE